MSSTQKERNHDWSDNMFMTVTHDDKVYNNLYVRLTVIISEIMPQNMLQQKYASTKKCFNNAYCTFLTETMLQWADMELKSISTAATASLVSLSVSASSSLPLPSSMAKATAAELGWSCDRSMSLTSSPSESSNTFIYLFIDIYDSHWHNCSPTKLEKQPTEYEWHSTVLPRFWQVMELGLPVFIALKTKSQLKLTSRQIFYTKRKFGRCQTIIQKFFFCQKQ